MDQLIKHHWEKFLSTSIFVRNWLLSIRPSPFHPKVTTRRDWEEWRTEAKQKALDGAFREAIRLLFISALVEGHQRDWWSYESETTNKEHLGRIEGQAERREALRSLIELYEKTWYGLGQPGRDEFQHCEHLVTRMESAA